MGGFLTLLVPGMLMGGSGPSAPIGGAIVLDTVYFPHVLLNAPAIKRIFVDRLNFPRTVVDEAWFAP